MALRGDLQLHSTASDGLWQPEALVQGLKAAGVQVAALTDHDTCLGVPAFAASAARAGIVAICGAEIAAEQDGAEVHLLSYFHALPTGPYRDILDRLSDERHGRAAKMLIQLRRVGISLDETQVLAQSQPGRPHVARALVAAGVVPDVPEAFERLLNPGRPGYVPRFRPAAKDVIVAAREQGGLTSLAHPCRYEHAPLEELTRAGIDAMEVVHPSASPAQTEMLRRTARDLGLRLVTGGSDFHAKSDDAPLGTYVLTGDDVERFLLRLGA